MSAPPARPAASPWAPLRLPVFRILWLAQLGSNIGTWMQTVGAQWFLVDAHASPTVVALVQTASLAPGVLLALHAGAIADVSDRRRLLVAGSLASAVVAAALAVVSALGLLEPWSLLGFTFLLGLLASLLAPAWQGIQPELVPRELIPAASGLGSVTVNGARAVGPALAGFLVAGFGPSTVFAINAVSFLGAAAALVRWNRPPQEGLEDREPLGAAVRAGFRYVRSAGLVRRILLRSALFTFPASALWALLPLVAGGRLELGSSGYGVLLGAVGGGALVGVFLLPGLRRRVSDNAMLAASSLGIAGGIAGTATLPLALAIAALVLAGAAWIGTLTVLNAALQLTLPQWVRSRGAAFYLLVFSGTMAAGSYLWGAVAEHTGTPGALLISAGVQALAGVTVRWWGLRPGTGMIDRTIGLSWPTPTLMLAPAPLDGPLTVTVRYAIRPADDAAFLVCMEGVERSRRRTGAVRWRLLRSAEDPTALLETFVVPSWSEFRRQQTDRLTGYDRDLQDRARSLSASAPVEEHLFLARDDIPAAAGPPGPVT